jgi:phosphate transport system substrate-binding protein
MRRTGVATLIGFVTLLISWGMIRNSTVHAQEPLRYSCSAQIFEAFETERIPAFTEATGIDVELYICSSLMAVSRLMNARSDIASTTQRLSHRQLGHGYVETTFCRDPLAVIVNEQCRVTDISEKQLQGIFNRDISNWREVGGPDQPIMLIVPGKDTAAYQNFERQVMALGEIEYDLMTYLSTQVIDAVKRFPWSISFIAQGAVANQVDVIKMKINGLSIKDKDYPYYQQFSFVTAGTPVGVAQAFIDFVLSEKGIQLIKKKGMIPIVPKTR